MAVVVSVGSGKGGTGKSTVASNLATVLAHRGRSVYLLDLDVGGADAHVLLGHFKNTVTLTDFLDHKVKTLPEASQVMDAFHGLRLIAGTGDTLSTANMPYVSKQRLMRHIVKLEADVVLLDVGAGTNLHALDFFMLADLQICVATPEPASTLDAYRFVKLAALRKTLSGFLSQDTVRRTLSKRSFETLEEVLQQAEQADPGARRAAEETLDNFRPALVVNQSRGSKLNTRKLEQLLRTFGGVELQVLGTIPADGTVPDAVRAYMPVCEWAPESPAARAFQQTADALLEHISRLQSASRV